MCLEENLRKIKDNLPESCSIIGVSKTRSIEEIKEVYNLGVLDFGENKVQELIEKSSSLGEDIRWHFIGHLQRNKVKYLVGLVYLIQSLDSERLLLEIEKEYKKALKIAKVLIEINIGREKNKSGILVEDLPKLIEEIEKCSNVLVLGIMSVIPQGDEKSCRNYFKELNKIYKELSEKNYKNITMEYLSMGMTGDYIYASEEGANMVRIGEGIFGKRNYNEEG